MKQQQAGSQIEANKILVRTFLSCVESGDFGEIFDEIVDENYNDHLQGQGTGRDNLKKYLMAIKTAFPDLKWPVHTIIAEGDFVAVYNQITGTHLADFGSFPASGRQVNVVAFQLYRIVDGKLAEHWELADFPALASQMRL